MTDRIINLRAWEAAALAEGRATALVRVCKPQPTEGFCGEMVDFGDGYWAMNDGDLSGEYRCPFGSPGDVILGREAWAAFDTPDYRTGECEEVDIRPSEMRVATVVYRADGYFAPDRWRSSITMPKWAIRARYTNAVVRCMRVQELTEIEAMWLGFPQWVLCSGSSVDHYRAQFDRDHGPGAWASNPWVFIARLTK